MINYNSKTKMINIRQFYIIRLPYTVYSRLTKNTVFKFFKLLKNHLFIVIRYEHRSSLTARYFKFGNVKIRLKKLEKLKIKDIHDPRTNFRSKDRDFLKVDKNEANESYT